MVENVRSSSAKREEPISVAEFMAIIAILLVVIIIAGLAYATLSYPSKSVQFPKFQNTSSPLPQGVSNMLGESSIETTEQLSNLARNHTSNLSAFTVSYNGSISIKPSESGLISISSPLTINDSRYLKNTKLALNATGIPVLGSADVVFSSIDNGTYVCSNFNSSAISSGNYGAIISGNHGITCTRGYLLSGLNLSDIAQFNLFALSNSGVQITYKEIYQSVYKGVPCIFIDGSIANPYNNGTGGFEMCVSNAYYVPLSLYLSYDNNQALVFLNLSETQIGSFASQRYTSELPGPISG